MFAVRSIRCVQRHQLWNRFKSTSSTIANIDADAENKKDEVEKKSNADVDEQSKPTPKQQQQEPARAPSKTLHGIPYSIVNFQSFSRTLQVNSVGIFSNS